MYDGPVRSGSRIGCDKVMGSTLTPSVERNVARLAQPLTASIPITIFSLAAVSLPLAAAQSLGLSSRQTGTWLFALYAAPGLASIVLTLAYRQPLLVAWHIAVVAFVASLSQTLPYPDLLGAMIVAGFVVAALGARSHDACRRARPRTCGLRGGCWQCLAICRRDV